MYDRLKHFKKIEAGEYERAYLIDWENICGYFYEFLEKYSDEIQNQLVIFFFREHDKIEFKILHELGEKNVSFDFLYCNGSGKNYLDFCLSAYCGVLAARNDKIKIIVVSNDHGYGNIESFLNDNFGVVIERILIERTNAQTRAMQEQLELCKKLNLYRPRERLFLGSIVYPLMFKACYSDEVKELVNRYNYLIKSRDKGSVLKIINDGKHLHIKGTKKGQSKFVLYANGWSMEDIHECSTTAIKDVFYREESIKSKRAYR